MIVYDIETFNTIKCVPYANCICRLCKKTGKLDRDITDRGHEKCRKDCIVSKETDGLNEMLDNFFTIQKRS